MKKFFGFVSEFFIFVLSVLFFLFAGAAHYSHCKIDKEYNRQRRIRKMRLF